jgi:hypothetical protein
MADAADLKSAARKGVRVRVSAPAPGLGPAVAGLALVLAACGGPDINGGVREEDLVTGVAAVAVGIDPVAKQVTIV